MNIIVIVKVEFLPKLLYWIALNFTGEPYKVATDCKKKCKKHCMVIILSQILKASKQGLHCSVQCVAV